MCDAMLKDRILKRRPWFDCTGRAEWAGSNVSAYRIWKFFDGLVWWQRHEWKKADGSIQMEDWIRGIDAQDSGEWEVVDLEDATRDAITAEVWEEAALFCEGWIEPTDESNDPVQHGTNATLRGLVAEFRRRAKEAEQ